MPPVAVQIHAGREAIGQKPRKVTCTFTLPFELSPEMTDSVKPVVN